MVWDAFLAPRLGQNVPETRNLGVKWLKLVEKTWRFPIISFDDSNVENDECHPSHFFCSLCWEDLDNCELLLRIISLEKGVGFLPRKIISFFRKKKQSLSKFIRGDPNNLGRRPLHPVKNYKSQLSFLFLFLFYHYYYFFFGGGVLVIQTSWKLEKALPVE